MELESTAKPLGAPVWGAVAQHMDTGRQTFMSKAVLHTNYGVLLS